MRTCLDGCSRLQAADVSAADLASQFMVLSGYCMYGGSFTADVVSRAKQVRQPPRSHLSTLLDCAQLHAVLL